MTKNGKRPGAPSGAPSASESPAAPASSEFVGQALLGPGEATNRMPIPLPLWHAVPCPGCSGTGRPPVYVGRDPLARCLICKGRMFVKVNVDELEALSPEKENNAT